MPESGAVDLWQLGDHLTVTYATDDECRDLLIAFARRGVAAGHRVVVFLDTGATDLGRALVAAVPRATPGQFTALHYGTGYGGAGFGVDDMLAGLAALRDETFAAGFPAISVAGQMIWTSRAGFAPAELLRYESAVNRFFGDARVAGLCMYDRRHFSKEQLTRISAVHPGPLLRFTLRGWGAHVRLDGEVDASNGAALPSILALVAATDGVVLVDASDLRFVDAAGAGEIVHFAASRPNRHTVVRCTRGVRQTLQLCGADSVPSLVLRDQVSGV